MNKMIMVLSFLCMVGILEAGSDVNIGQLKAISFPEVTFDKIRPSDAITWIRNASREHDVSEDKDGVNIVLMDNLKYRRNKNDAGKKPKSTPLITMRAKNISLYEVLNIVTDMGDLKWRIRGKVIVVLPKDYPDKDLNVRYYNAVPASIKQVK